MFIDIFIKQKTAYELRISDWSSDVCSSDLPLAPELVEEAACIAEQADPDILAIEDHTIVALHLFMKRFVDNKDEAPLSHRSEESRVGKTWVSTGRAGWSPSHEKKKINTNATNTKKTTVHISNHTDSK